MKIELNKQETINLISWNFGKRKFLLINSSLKAILFHGTETGKNIKVSKLYLYFLYILGYSFICCHPKIVKANLGFGNFLFDGTSGMLEYDINMNTKKQNSFINVRPYHKSNSIYRRNKNI